MKVKGSAWFLCCKTEMYFLASSSCFLSISFSFWVFSNSSPFSPSWLLLYMGKLENKLSCSWGWGCYCCCCCWGSDLVLTTGSQALKVLSKSDGNCFFSMAGSSLAKRDT